MKAITTIIRASGLLVAFALSTTSHAALVDRGGGLFYDTVLDITWLQDANYANTSAYVTPAGRNVTIPIAFPGPGAMRWAEAMEWADSLNYYDSVRNVTWSDWRLPTASPVNGVNWSWDNNLIGAADGSYNISAPGSVYPGTTANELAYMYFNNLQNAAACPVTGWQYCTGGRFLPKPGPFVNLQAGAYWANIKDPLPYLGDALGFYYGARNWGAQGGVYSIDYWFAWAVRKGDVASARALPEPTTLSLLAVALLVALSMTKLRARSSRDTKRYK